jgi:uncharacterized caspase-like protein
LISSDRFGYKIYENNPIIGSNLEMTDKFSRIQKSIIQFFYTASIGQTLLFYFSGHGIPRENDEVFLATPDVDPKEPLLGGFRISDLTRLVNSSRAREIICIIDSCYSGSATSNTSYRAMSGEEQEETAVDTVQRTSKKLLEDLLKREQRYFLLSTQSYLKSYAPMENKDLRSNSVYTKYLIEALKGAKRTMNKEGKYASYTGSVDDNGYITPETLHRYVNYMVKNEVPSQDPVIKSTLSGGDQLLLPTIPIWLFLHLWII